MVVSTTKRPQNVLANTSYSRESEINKALCLSILKDLNLLGPLVHYCQLECGYGFPALIHVWIASAGMSEWFISTSGEAMIASKPF